MLPSLCAFYNSGVTSNAHILMLSLETEKWISEALVLEKKKEAERHGAVQDMEENWPLSRTVHRIFI